MEILAVVLYLLGLSHLIINLGQLIWGVRGGKKDHHTESPSVKEQSCHDVVILIPVCNENDRILMNTLLNCKKIQGDPDIVVLENSRDPFAKKKNVAVCKKLKITYYSFENPGNKAKALNWFVLSVRNGYRYIIILDTDQQPTEKLVTFLLNQISGQESIALVQTAQSFRNKRYNLATYLYCNMQDIFYKGLSVCRGNIGFATCFGTNFIIRSSALKEIGGFDEACVTEDTATSFRLREAGWNVVYSPVTLALGLAPHSINTFAVQLRRYAKGNRQLLLRLTGMLIRDGLRNLSLKEYLFYIHYCSALVITSSFILLNAFYNWQGVQRVFICITPLLSILFVGIVSTKMRAKDVLLGGVFYTILSPAIFLNSINIFDNSSSFIVKKKREIFK